MSLTFHDFCELFHIDPGVLAQLTQEAYELYLCNIKEMEGTGINWDDYEPDFGSAREEAIFHFLCLLMGEV